MKMREILCKIANVSGFRNWLQQLGKMGAIAAPAPISDSHFELEGNGCLKGH